MPLYLQLSNLINEKMNFTHIVHVRIAENKTQLHVVNKYTCTLKMYVNIAIFFNKTNKYMKW